MLDGAMGLGRGERGPPGGPSKSCFGPLSAVNQVVQLANESANAANGENQPPNFQEQQMQQARDLSDGQMAPKSRVLTIRRLRRRSSLVGPS